METSKKNKNKSKKGIRKTVFGIKLPPIEPCDDGEHIKTTMDIDPAFYSLIDGRPVRPNTSIRAYKKYIKDIALKRTLHGFITDEILRIDREMESEKMIYDNTVINFEDYKNSFDKFLADDNNKTIAVMTKSDNMVKELMNMTEDQKQVIFEMASLRAKLQYIDESLTILLSFENFLLKASPILWQTEHNIQLDVKHDEIITMSNDIFQELDVAEITNKLVALPPPRLFFQKPEQLLKVFEALENQNLNYFLVTSELNLQKNKFLKAVEMMKTLLKRELDIIQQEIDKTKEFIQWNELREVQLREEFFRILEEKINYLVSSETVLKVYNYVEYAYTKLIATNETNLSALDMTLALETEYNDIMMDLSVFDLEELKKIEKETYENEARCQQQAKVASKLLKEVDKLSKRLKSSYQPPYRKIL